MDSNYTTGNMFLLNGIDYEGYYNIYNGVYYTGNVYSYGISNKLTEKDNIINKLINDYNKLNSTFSKKELYYPVNYQHVLTNKEIKNGYFYRYVVQNKKSKEIIEVSLKGYNKTDKLIYDKVKIRWSIKGNSKMILDRNKRNVLKHINIIKNLDKFFPYYLEFFIDNIEI